MQNRLLPCFLVVLVAWSCQLEKPVAEVSANPAVVSLDHGRYTEITLDWRLLEDLGPGGESPIVFVHLSHPEKGVLRTFDHPFDRPWRAGDAVRYQLPIHQSAVGPSLEPGSYDLTLGLYDGASQRWQLLGANEVATREYSIATVTVEDAAEGGPSFLFSEQWTSVEPGGDAQVLGRRWMLEPGSIELVAKPSEATTLWISLTIPEVVGNLQLVLDDGVEGAAVRVISQCDGFEATLTGSGSHSLEIPIDTTSCRVDLESNFHVVESTTLERVVLAVEGLAWR